MSKDNGFHHQDWNEVILRKPVEIKKNEHKPNQKSKVQQLLEGNDIVAPLKTNKELKEGLENKNFKTNLNLIQTYKTLSISEGMRLEPNNPVFLLKGKK